ncbi:unnamed protein product [Symbiodinium necroappetens]|uniref:Uncharacterized protein n=1 Tax=Symbiodinium necroappetens TaxID=1628268 RepID=A0A812NCI8_9DINO|nr:unnamed protein product [Symbiodinium necroappetens]
MATRNASGQLISVDWQQEQDPQGEVKITEVQMLVCNVHDVEDLFESQIARLRQEFQLEFTDLRSRLENVERQLTGPVGPSVRRYTSGSKSVESPSNANASTINDP